MAAQFWRSHRLQSLPTENSMVLDIASFCNAVSSTMYLAAYWLSFITVLAFCHNVFATITIQPVSHHKGGETVSKKLVSLYGQLPFCILLDFQAQF